MQLSESFSVHKGREITVKRIKPKGITAESTINKIIGVKTIKRASKVEEEYTSLIAASAREKDQTRMSM